MGVPTQVVASLLGRAFKEKIIPAIGEEMVRARGVKVRVGDVYFFFSHMEQRGYGRPIYRREGGGRVVGYKVQVPLMTPLILLVDGRERGITVVWNVKAEVWVGSGAGDPPAVLAVGADAVQVEGSPLRCKTPLLLATTTVSKTEIEAEGLPPLDRLTPDKDDISKVAHYLLLHLDESWVGLKLVGEKLTSTFAEVVSRVGTFRVQGAMGEGYFLDPPPQTYTGYYTVEEVRATPKMVVDFRHPSVGQGGTTYIVTYEIEGTIKIKFEFDIPHPNLEATLPMTLRMEWEISEQASPPPDRGGAKAKITAYLQIKRIPPFNSYVETSYLISHRVIGSDRQASLPNLLPSRDEIENALKNLLEGVHQKMRRLAYMWLLYTI